MTALLLETALLLIGAYFVGAFVGCLLRRTFYAEPVEVVDFHRAAPVVEAVSPVAVAAPRRLPDHEPIRPKIESIPETVSLPQSEPDDAALAETTQRFQRSLTQSDGYVYPKATEHAEASEPVVAEAPSPAPPPVAAPPSEPVVVAPPPPPAPPAPVVAKAPEAPPPAEPVAVAPPSVAVESSPPPAVAKTPEAAEQQPPKSEPSPASPARGFSGTSAAAAQAMAAVAAMGARRSDTATPSGQPKPSAGPAPAPQATPVATGALDDLTRIRAIDTALQDKLRQAGVHRFADVAAWGPDDVQKISDTLGFKGRIEHENWIEQAQILASGGKTAYARQTQNAGQKLAQPSADEGTSRKPATGAPLASVAAVSGIGAAVAASIAALPPRRPAALALGRDNLQRVSQISEEVERLLNAKGVSRYDQIANWSRAEVTRFEALLGNEGRISRENWIEQAHILARGGETAYARTFDSKAAEAAPEARRPTKLAEAIRTAPHPDAAHDDATPEKKVDLTALRSVRSEALRGGEVSPAAIGTIGGATPPVRPDDLKRIRGVGVLIEKRLNAMGVWRYEQIANWTSSDINRVSQALEFRGRIERENWVEQARILTSGGQTEFAKRVDRGEVETSRPKS